MNERSVTQLQQEAALRVQRMTEHSRRLVREHPVNIYRGVTLTPPEIVQPVCKHESACDTTDEPEKRCCLPEQKPREKDWLSFLAGDQERVLLLLLILVLGHNGAPAELLLALLYIAL